MGLLTVREREEAAASDLWDLYWRLQQDYRRSGGSLRPELVREPGLLRELVERLETLTGDCRELLRRKLEAMPHGLETAAGVGLAGGAALAGGVGRAGSSAQG